MTDMSVQDQPYEAGMGDYFALMKPRVMSLVIFTALVGLLVAPTPVHPFIGFLAILCIAVGAGASGALNMWWDADIDAIMRRTKSRPIPSGRVPGNVALWFAMVWTLLAQSWALMLGPWVAAATFIGLLLAWAYSAPPLRLKLNGWWGNSAVALSYEGLAWITGAAIVLGGDLPPAPILIIALLYSVGAHGIMTLNDFKSVEGDLQMGIRSLPAQLGRERAAKVACVFMLLPQLVVIALLLQWQLAPYAAAVTAVVVAQCLAMKRLLSDPKQLAPWYNATGVSLYVLGMMSAAVGLGGWFA